MAWVGHQEPALSQVPGAVLGDEAGVLDGWAGSPFERHSVVAHRPARMLEILRAPTSERVLRGCSIAQRGCHGSDLQLMCPPSRQRSLTAVRTKRRVDGNWVGQLGSWSAMTTRPYTGCDCDASGQRADMEQLIKLTVQRHNGGVRNSRSWNVGKAAPTWARCGRLLGEDR